MTGCKAGPTKPISHGGTVLPDRLPCSRTGFQPVSDRLEACPWSLYIPPGQPSWDDEALRLSFRAESAEPRNPGNARVDPAKLGLVVRAITEFHSPRAQPIGGIAIHRANEPTRQEWWKVINRARLPYRPLCRLVARVAREELGYGEYDKPERWRMTPHRRDSSAPQTPLGMTVQRSLIIPKLVRSSRRLKMYKLERQAGSLSHEARNKHNTSIEA
jgi:hypothetical protein